MEKQHLTEGTKGIRCYSPRTVAGQYFLLGSTSRQAEIFMDSK